MKRDIRRILLGICWTSFLAGGCANKELVKKEEPVAATAHPAATVKAKEEPVNALPVQAASVNTAKAEGAEAKEAVQELHPLSDAAQLRAELEHIYFDFDSALLLSAARQALVKNAELIKKSSVVKITIEGHCDERGSDEYNLALGEKRAKAARNFLATLGVPAVHLSVVSYGREKPAVPGHDESAWAKNRRDEFVIVE